MLLKNLEMGKFGANFGVPGFVAPFEKTHHKIQQVCPANLCTQEGTTCRPLPGEAKPSLLFFFPKKTHVVMFVSIFSSSHVHAPKWNNHSETQRPSLFSRRGLTQECMKRTGWVSRYFPPQKKPILVWVQPSRHLENKNMRKGASQVPTPQF